VDEGEGDPRSDAGQQFIKLGTGQAEVPLTAGVIQAQLLERANGEIRQTVRLRRVRWTQIRRRWSPRRCSCSPEQIQCGESLDECLININKEGRQRVSVLTHILQTFYFTRVSFALDARNNTKWSSIKLDTADANLRRYSHPLWT